MDIDTQKQISALVRGRRHDTPQQYIASYNNIEYCQFAPTSPGADGVGAGKHFSAANARLYAPGNDSVQANYLDVNAYLYNIAESVAAPRPPYRLIVLWFNKPYKPATSGGSYSTEATTTVASPFGVQAMTDILGFKMILAPSERETPFTVLADKFYTASTSAGMMVRERIQINRRIHFEQPPTATQNGGHYDADTDVGRISRGFLVAYWLGGAGQETPCYYRLNYTA